MRVVVVDPQAYTPPYDDELCRALAAAGAEVELLTAHFTHGAAPAPDGYVRHELFGPPLSGLLERRPTSRVRVPLKLGGHVTGLGRLVRRVRSRRPDVVHWQWAPLPALDLRALRAAGRSAGATVFTAHDVLPRRSRNAAPLWAELYGSCDRVIVHGAASRDRLLVEVGGIAPDRIAVIPHALLHAGSETAPPAGADGAAHPLLRPDPPRQGARRADRSHARGRRARPRRAPGDRRQPAHADGARAPAGQRARPRWADQLGSALRARRGRTRRARPGARDRPPLPLDRGLRRVRDRTRARRASRSSPPSARSPSCARSTTWATPCHPTILRRWQSPSYER